MPYRAKKSEDQADTSLVSWFRTPGAYVHNVPDPIPENMDLSYWTKVCHVCRTYIVNRPIRMYHLQSILEPLGVDTHIPIALQTAKAGSAEDPWRNSFPEDKDSYRIHDESDNVDRCPACLGEIDEGSCSHCGAQFSEEEEVEDFDTGDENEGNDDEDDGDDASDIQYLGSDDGSRNRRDEHGGSDTSTRRALRENRAPPRRPRADTATDEEGNGSEDSDIVALEHPRRSRRTGSSRQTSPGSGTRGDRRSRRSSGTGDETIADDALSQSGDSESDSLPARPRRPSPRRRRFDEQLNPRGRRDRAGSSYRLRDYLDMFARDSDDGMTEDEGDDPVGETGDYGYSSTTGEERSIDDSEESAYEGSFIDDDDDISGSEGEGGDGGEDETGHLDLDDDDLEDSVILRSSRRAGSRIGGARHGGRGSVYDEDSQSEGGSEVGLDEMRRRRLLAYGRQGR